ncbi:MAG: DUF4332 domain-containing protein [Thermoplasmatota archaeon]
MTGDALRNTLDALALDPEAGADRHYLVTMLRRLGYSEEEIRHVLGDEGEEGRVIEVEYTGKGATFLFGKPGKTQRFRVSQDDDGPAQFSIVGEDEAQTFTLAGDSEAGTETFEGVDLDDVDVSDDWGDWDDGEEAPDDFEGDDLEVEPTEERIVSFREAPLAQFREHEQPTGWTEVDGPDTWAVDEAPADAWAPSEEEPLEWAEPEEVWEDVPEEPVAYTYGDYTLYTRPVELTTGKTQHIYFFAKDEPKSGQACAMPDGYEVGVSEKTGLPFLRKATGQADGAAHDAGAIDAGHDLPHDYLGDIHEVVDLEGIGPTYEKKLHDAGIHNTQQLLFTDDAALQDITGAPGKTVQNWKHMSQLLKINGIGPQFAELMVRAGIEGIDGLRGGDPEAMVAQVKAYEAGLKNQVTGSGIGIKRMTDWHEQAKAMQKGPIDVDALNVHDLESRAALRDSGDGGHPKVREGPETWGQTESADAAPQTRVRVKRVAAQDAESAREALAREGANVRGVVPIRVEEHDE